MVKLIFFITSIWGYNSAPPDSLRTETINGKLFIVHQVESKETLYGISKRYRVSIKQILKFNSQADRGLNIGQTLNIPAPLPRTKNIYHEVQPKETLHSIATLYGMQENELKALNNLNNSTVSPGQQLRVRQQAKKPPKNIPSSTTAKKVGKGFHKVAPGQTLYSLAHLYNTTVGKLKEWNSITGSNLNVGQIIRVTRPNEERPERKKTSSVPPQNKPMRISENIIGTDEIKEAGLAELIDGAIGKRKYLAMHRMAPIGSILKVRNMLNNREVFVRVIGLLSPTETDDELIIKISKSAFDKLGGADAQLKVDVTYYK